MANILSFHLPSLHLEHGDTLAHPQLAYTDTGGLGKPVLWICHALTGSADPTAWWDGLIGRGRLYDPANWRIVCANLLGSCYGSTGPLSNDPGTDEPYFHNFPRLTVRDQVQALIHLQRALGIRQIHTLIGGSLGGQVAIEWAIQRPDNVQHLVLLATNARHSAWGIAWNETQRQAIYLDPTWTENRPDAGLAGMQVARQQAMISYRSYEQYEATQYDSFNPDGEPLLRRAGSYQLHQGRKLAERFNAFSYVSLSLQMDSHDVGRDRGSAQIALASVLARTLTVGISSDLLFPPTEQRFLAAYIPGATYAEIDSPYGHDGFLVEYEAIAQHISRLYQRQSNLIQPQTA